MAGDTWHASEVVAAREPVRRGARQTFASVSGVTARPAARGARPGPRVLNGSRAQTARRRFRESRVRTWASQHQTRAYRSDIEVPIFGSGASIIVRASRINSTVLQAPDSPQHGDCSVGQIE
jgi:hypothetical protein